MSNADEQTSLLRCRQGLHILRYAKALDALSPPIVMIEAPPGVEIVAPPHAPADRLDGPGAIVIVRATADVMVPLLIRPRRLGGSCAADINLETIALVPSVLPAPAPEQNANAPELSGPGRIAIGSGEPQWGVPQIELLAHLARRGDVNVHAGEWAGGPAVPTQIEGLDLRIAGLPGSALEYQVCAAGVWSNWVNGGSYAGSRGRALPLTGLRLRLSEHALSGLVLHAEAIFLGAAIVRRTGRRIDLSTAMGLDPLVGLRISCTRELNEISPGAIPVSHAAEKHGAKVRIFRASALAAAAPAFA